MTDRYAVERIVILGGGTSGWLSAGYLSMIYGPKSLQRLDITLIESKDIGTIGVGEATIPTLRQSLKKVGIAERDFFARCDASFKLGIKFVNWHHSPGDDPNDIFWNPFGNLPTAWSLPALSYWLESFPGAPPSHFFDSFTVHIPLARANKAPKAADTKPYEHLASYAYHMDAHLFGGYLREIATARGIRRLEDTVTAVEQDERGFITRLKLASGRTVEGDLFIDCSGFRSLLLQQTLGEGFGSFEESLLCDSAIAISKPWPADHTSLRPYTTATAHEAGWSWNIPLHSREACGYVYSAKHKSPEAAEREFRRFIGDPDGKHPAQHIKMRTGRVDKFWSKNCIAIGLAGGFIEPLESTGIYMVEAGLRELEHYFPDKAMSPPLRDHYNAHMRFIYDQTKDFICYHYCMTEREDTDFWRDNRHALKKSDDLQDLLKLWESKVPSAIDFTPRIFNQDQYSFLMVGHRAWPKRRPAASDVLDPEDGARLIELVARKKQVVMSQALDHLAWLERQPGEEAAA